MFKHSKNTIAVDEPAAGEHRNAAAWADKVSAALPPHAPPGGYPNLLSPDDDEQIAKAYGDRL